MMLQDSDLLKMQNELRQPEPPKKEKKSKKGLIVVLVLILVVGVACGVFFLTKSKKSATKPKDEVVTEENANKIYVEKDEGLVLLEEVFNDKWDKEVEDLEEENFTDGDDQDIIGADGEDDGSQDEGEELDDGCNDLSDWYRYKNYLILIEENECTGETTITIYDNNKNTLEVVDLVYYEFISNDSKDDDDGIICKPLIKDGKLYFMRAKSREEVSPNYLEYIDLKNELKRVTVKEYNLDHVID